MNNLTSRASAEPGSATVVVDGWQAQVGHEYPAPRDGAAPAVVSRSLRPVSTVDEVIFGDQSWVELPLERQREIQLEVLRDAFDLHLSACPGYAAFAENRRVAPDQIQCWGDLVRIPQFPTSVFKRQRLMSVPLGDVVTSFTSSGTSGTRSTIYRDARTLQRLCGTMRPDNPLFADILAGADESNTEVVNLGPSRREAANVWFGYVMSLLEQIAPMSTHVVAGKFHVDAAVSRIRELLRARRRVVVAGPPFLVRELCEHVLRSGRPMEGADALFVFTGGGWKGREADRLDRAALAETVGAALGTAGESQMRDVFNQVELNTLLVECERHRKHVPPWVHVCARDPATFDALPDGEAGVLCFSDASARSYPCFFVGDDIGAVSSKTCACGRPGNTLRIVRRLRQTSHAGCADTLRETVAGTGTVPHPPLPQPVAGR